MVLEVEIKCLTVQGRDAVRKGLEDFDKEGIKKRDEWSKKYYQKIIAEEPFIFVVGIQDMYRKIIMDGLIKSRRWIKGVSNILVFDGFLNELRRDMIQTMRLNGATLNKDFVVSLVNDLELGNYTSDLNKSKDKDALGLEIK